jgi:hypothetical protein
MEQISECLLKLIVFMTPYLRPQTIWAKNNYGYIFSGFMVGAQCVASALGLELRMLTVFNRFGKPCSCHLQGKWPNASQRLSKLWNTLKYSNRPSPASRGIATFTMWCLGVQGNGNEKTGSRKFRFLRPLPDNQQNTGRRKSVKSFK